jgi:hypothetical protein
MSLPVLPPALRRLTPERLRDDVRLRALAVGLGVIPPRTMHSQEDAAVLLQAARRARCVVEIGVYEGSSAVELCGALPAHAELHLVDPFGRHPDALPFGWAATEWATRRVVSRALGRRGPQAPAVRWHVCLSAELAYSWPLDAGRGGPGVGGAAVDLVFIDGDHSESGCELDWSQWHRFVPIGGHVVFHDARADRPVGRGLPGPTAVIHRHFRCGAGTPGWEIAAEADRTVAVCRVA